MHNGIKKAIAGILTTATLLGTVVPGVAFEGNEVGYEVEIGDSDYINFQQNDPRWGSYEYGGGCTIGDTGCMITSIAMLMAYSDANLRDSTVFNPMELAKVMNFAGGAVIWDSAENYDGNFKLVTSNLLREKNGDIKDLIFNELDAGRYVIAYADNVYSGSGAGHYSPVVGWDYDLDEPIVKDVASGGLGWGRWEECGVSQVVVYESSINPSYNVLKGGLGYLNMPINEDIEESNEESKEDNTSEESAVFEAIDVSIKIEEGSEKLANITYID